MGQNTITKSIEISNISLLISIKNLEELIEALNGFVWHRDYNQNIIIRFRDARLGRLGILTRKRSCYLDGCQFMINILNTTPIEVDKVIREIIDLTMSLPNFNPKNYVVYHTKISKHIIVKDIIEYNEALKFANYPAEYYLLDPQK